MRTYIKPVVEHGCIHTLQYFFFFFFLKWSLSYCCSRNGAREEGVSLNGAHRQAQWGFNYLRCPCIYEYSS